MAKLQSKHNLKKCIAGAGMQVCAMHWNQRGAGSRVGPVWFWSELSSTGHPGPDMAADAHFPSIHIH